MNIQDQINYKLNVLRQRWKDQPDKRDIIKLQARALTLALEKLNKTDSNFEQTVMENLL